MTTTTTISNPFTLANGRVIQNRIIKSAMSEQLGESTLNPGKGLVNVYRRWSEGGSGVLISGNIMVDRNHLGEPSNVALDEQSDLAAFKRWAEAGISAGNEFWAQLNHPGRQIPSYLNKQPVAPSAVPLGRGLEKAFATPRALTEEEIQDIIGKFATAARLSKQAGFTGIQIHAAHGYLVSQFLSPLSNQRDDQWGGSLENRMRFLMSVYAAIRNTVGPDFPVTIKLNSADFMKGGFSEEDSMQVVEQLAAAGIDLVEISGGTYEQPEMAKDAPRESTRKREAFFMDYAEQLRKRVNVPLMVTGGFRSTAGMNAALASDALDFVGIARPLAVVPDLARQAMNNDDYEIALPRLTTGVKLLDLMSMLDLTWYEVQIWRMARNQDPKPSLSPWRSFATTMLSNGISTFRLRRA